MKLTIKQTQALDFLEDDITTELFFGGGAGGGKSALGCYWQLKNRMKYAGSRGCLARKTLKDLKETTLNTFFQIAKMQGIRNGIDFVYKEQAGVIKFANGSEIYLKELKYLPADKDFDRFGSLELTDIFIDEAPQILRKAKDVIKSRLRYKLDEFGLIPKMMLSGNPTKNWIYKDYYLRWKNGELRDHVKFIQALAKDNKHTPKVYIDSLMTLGKAMVQRLLFGNWEYDDDPTSLIDYDNIIALFENDHIDRGTDRYITADIARQGSDKAIISVWYGFEIVEFRVFEKSKTTEIQDAINELRKKHNIPKKNAVADEDGVGGGVVDNCGIQGFSNGAKPMNDENYENLKTQCIYKMAEMIQDNEIYISAPLSARHKDEIIEEMEYVKSFDQDKDGKLKILPKPKIKMLLGRSPDWMDTIMMRMIFTYKRKFIGNFTTT